MANLAVLAPIVPDDPPGRGRVVRLLGAPTQAPASTGASWRPGVAVR
jgi:hypothetical protein